MIRFKKTHIIQPKPNNKTEEGMLTLKMAHISFVA